MGLEAESEPQQLWLVGVNSFALAGAGAVGLTCATDRPRGRKRPPLLTEAPAVGGFACVGG